MKKLTEKKIRQMKRRRHRKLRQTILHNYKHAHTYIHALVLHTACFYTKTPTNTLVNRVTDAFLRRNLCTQSILHRHFCTQVPLFAGSL